MFLFSSPSKCCFRSMLFLNRPVKIWSVIYFSGKILSSLFCWVVFGVKFVFPVRRFFLFAVSYFAHVSFSFPIFYPEQRLKQSYVFARSKRYLWYQVIYVCLFVCFFMRKNILWYRIFPRKVSFSLFCFIPLHKFPKIPVASFIRSPAFCFRYVATTY